ATDRGAKRVRRSIGGGTALGAPDDRRPRCDPRPDLGVERGDDGAPLLWALRSTIGAGGRPKAVGEDTREPRADASRHEHAKTPRWRRAGESDVVPESLTRWRGTLSIRGASGARSR